MYAITPRGIGKKVGARAIHTGMDLVNGETFKTTDWSEDMVLAEDEVSLRKAVGNERQHVINAKQKRITDKREAALEGILNSSNDSAVSAYRTERDSQN